MNGIHRLSQLCASNENKAIEHERISVVFQFQSINVCASTWDKGRVRRSDQGYRVHFSINKL